MENKEQNEQNEKREKREEIFSQIVRAGKRTYFFDVKATRSEELYLTITESKRRFNNEQGRFFYEKHKVFLYQEDFQKFLDGLNGAIGFIETKTPPVDPENTENKDTSFKTDLEFEDLGRDDGPESDS